MVGYFQRHPPDGTSYANARRAGNLGDGDAPASAAHAAAAAPADTVESDSGV